MSKLIKSQIEELESRLKETREYITRYSEMMKGKNYESTVMAGLKKDEESLINAINDLKSQLEKQE